MDMNPVVIPNRLASPARVLHQLKKSVGNVRIEHRRTRARQKQQIHTPQPGEPRLDGIEKEFRRAFSFGDTQKQKARFQAPDTARQNESHTVEQGSVQQPPNLSLQPASNSKTP